MLTTVEIFCPFSLGEKPMEESGFFPEIEAGRHNCSVVIIPGVESLVYRVNIPIDEAAEAEENGELGTPARVLRAGETFYTPVNYIPDNYPTRFHGYPYVARIKQH